MRVVGAMGSFLLNSLQSKRALLLFDEIYTATISSFEADTLIDFAAMVGESKPTGIISLPSGEGRRLRELLETSGAVKIWPDPTDYDCVGDFYAIPVDTRARRVATEASQALGVSVAAMVGRDEVVGPNVALAATLRLVIEALPLPSADTAYEAIMEWRADPDSRARHVRLRAWLASLTRTGTVVDEDELATLIDDYDTYMRKHHKTMERTRVEIVAVGIAQAVEDAAHFKLSSAAEKLFNLFTKETTVMEAELQAPARQIAYIASARQRFK